MLNIPIKILFTLLHCSEIGELEFSEKKKLKNVSPESFGLAPIIFANLFFRIL